MLNQLAAAKIIFPAVNATNSTKSLPMRTGVGWRADVNAQYEEFPKSATGSSCNTIGR